jgi:hypothetical protein
MTPYRGGMLEGAPDDGPTPFGPPRGHAMRVFAAVPVALVLIAAPAFADAQQHVQAAKKAERRGEWSKALEEWKAAYSADSNAEYLIGIGDAYAKMGNKDEAKKNYEAYLSDPLALPDNVNKVKGKIVELDNALALPGGPPGLSLPGGPADPLALPTDNSKKGKKGKKETAAPSLPGLDLPGAPEAKKEAPAFPGLDLPMAPAPAPAKKEPEKKVALLDLPGAPPPPAPAPAKKEVASLDLPLPAPAPPAKKEPPPPAREASKPPPQPKQIAMATPPPKPPERRPVPDAAIAEVPVARGQPSSGVTRIVAFAAAGVAVVALGGGALAMTKASAAHSDLVGKVHDGATAQQLLETEQRNKTVSFLSFAGGLVAAGIATALFAF